MTDGGNKVHCFCLRIKRFPRNNNRTATSTLKWIRCAVWGTGTGDVVVGGYISGMVL